MANPKTQIALIAILRHLKVPLSVASKDDRLMMQKAIYLAQVSGAKLGYSYSWYINGPYSPGLTEDYYEVEGRQDEFKNITVSGELGERLSPVTQVIERKPANVALVDWLEATASLSYMVRVQRKDAQSVVAACGNHKPHLEAVLSDAFDAISEAKLI